MSSRKCLLNFFNGLFNAVDELSNMAYFQMTRICLSEQFQIWIFFLWKLKKPFSKMRWRAFTKRKEHSRIMNENSRDKNINFFNFSCGWGLTMHLIRKYWLTLCISVKSTRWFTTNSNFHYPSQYDQHKRHYDGIATNHIAVRRLLSSSLLSQKKTFKILSRRHKVFGNKNKYRYFKLILILFSFHLFLPSLLLL